MALDAAVGGSSRLGGPDPEPPDAAPVLAFRGLDTVDRKDSPVTGSSPHSKYLQQNN